MRAAMDLPSNETAADVTSGSDPPATTVITPESILFALLMSVCILVTIVGNVLVVLSVFTYRPLRVVQNFYIVSLAVADLAVAILVMPFNVVNTVLLGRWTFGAVFCSVWLTCDILTCTASILNLCAIAVDRYYAIHDPIEYARKRTVRRVLVAVAVVWIASAIISIPPLFGWNNAWREDVDADGESALTGGNGSVGVDVSASPRSAESRWRLYDERHQRCQLTNEKSYVIYSASGSFYIPLVVMVFVYVNIYTATRARLRARASGGLWSNATTMTVRQTPPPARAALLVMTPPTQKKEGIENDGVATVDENSPRQNRPPVQLANGSCRGNAPLERPSTLIPTTESTVSTPVKYSLASGLSPRRFRQFVIDSPALKRFTERSRLRDVRSVTADAASTDEDHQKQRLTASVRSTGNGTVTTTKSSQFSQFLEEKQRISLSRERRAARTMAVVMGAFVLCWLPFFLMYVIFPFCPSCDKNTDPRVVNFIVWLGYVNSSLNPLIYTVFNVDFRRAFKALLQGKCRLDQPSRH